MPAAASWVAGLACATAASLAGADTNTNFAPVTAPASGYFGVESPETIESGALHVATTFDAGRRLLVVRDPMSDAIVAGGEIVAERLALHLAASVGVTERFELTGVLSSAIQRGDEAVDRPAVRSAAIGDLRLRGKLRLWQHGGLAIAGALEVSLPTSSSDAMFGDRTLVLTPRLVAGAHGERVEFAVEAGYRLRGANQFRDLSVDDEVVAGFAARYRIATRVWAQAELDAALGVQGHGNAAERPVEALAGLRVRIDDHWLAQAGMGVGIGRGYGAPELRGLVMIGYAPQPLQAGPEQVAWMPPETADEKAEVDVPALLPPEPERVDNEQSFHVVGDRIVLQASVLFELDSADIQESGRRVLGALVQVWSQHPDWAEITVEGHADLRGLAAANQRLSERRAQRVREVLIELGVAPDRLRAVGYGDSRPMTRGTSEADHARNRRVELVITRRQVED